MNKIVLAIVIIVIVIIAGIAISSLGGAPAVINGDVTVYIETVPQTANYTQPQTLDWGTVMAGNVYTKNFTVTNTGAQPYSLLLLTTEPAGTSQTWAYNNTVLPANNFASGSLTLTLSTSPSAGAYTWRLLATNGTVATPTPTVNPSATPTPNSLNITISADNNVESISISINNAAPYTITTLNQRVIPFTAGDDLRLTPTFVTGYTLNGWIFQDGSVSTAATLTLPNVNSNIEVVCESKTAPTPTATP